MKIDSLTVADANDRLETLCDLLVDVVDGGHSVGFLRPMDREAARSYWRGVFGQLEQHAVALLLAADGSGTVQLQPARFPNGRHRADVAKLLVHSSSRRRGVGSALMSELEAEARRRAISLLVLDTVTGSPAEDFYRSLGWTIAGLIPGFALTPDGALAGTTVLYKQLNGWNEVPQAQS